jgi:hypothetical protein
MSADTDQEPQPGLISLDVTGAPRLDVSLGGIITCIVIGLLLGIVVIFALQFPIYLIESYLSEKSYLSEPYDRWLESIDQSWTESRWIYSIIVLPTCVFLVNAYDARSLRVRAREFKLPYYDVPYSEARRVVGAALHRRWFRHPRFWSAINACAAPLLIVAL